jgi:fatty-acyl-CoA synthase
MAGMVLVVLNRAYRSREMTFVLQQSGVVALFLTDSYRGFDMRSMIADARPMTPALREILSLSEWDDFLASADQEQALPEPKPGDLLQIQYTSGTTGFPKGPRPTTKGLSTRPHSSLNGLAWTTAGSTSTRCRCTTLAVEW